MNARELEGFVLRVVDEVLDTDIDFMTISEVLEDDELSDDDLAEVHQEANDLMRYLRDRTDYYYD